MVVLMCHTIGESSSNQRLSTSLIIVGSGIFWHFLDLKGCLPWPDPSDSTWIRNPRESEWIWGTEVATLRNRKKPCEFLCPAQSREVSLVIPPALTESRIFRNISELTSYLHKPFAVRIVGELAVQSIVARREIICSDHTATKENDANREGQQGQLRSTYYILVILYSYVVGDCANLNIVYE
jgi:hypothetical protein